MGIEEFVNTTISGTRVGLKGSGFGMPVILSFTAGWAERIRYYRTITAVAVDFAVTTVEWAQAAIAFAAEKSPPMIAIARCANIPTQIHTLSVKSVRNTTVYSVTLNGVAVTVTSDGTATNDEIIALFQTAFLALPSAGITQDVTVTGAGGSHVLVITAHTAGQFNGVAITNPDLLSIVESTANPGTGVEADLTAILLAAPTEWYAVYCAYASAAIVTAISTWVEANKKFYLFNTQDTPVINDANSGATDIGHTLKVSARARTAWLYHPDNKSFAALGWLGECLPRKPGSETWMFKTLASVATVEMSDTHVTNVEAKNGNWYRDVGENWTGRGVVAAGEYIDVVRFYDWFKMRLNTEYVRTLAAGGKNPFDDVGILKIKNALLGVCAEGIASGGLSSDKEDKPVVTVPASADVTTADRALRYLRGTQLTARLAGAIQGGDISAVVSA